MEMMSRGFISDFFGWASIACWLGAQFPQVLENIRRRSCEGLALPFLLNWLLGDVTNLIGCVLTHQLPFQTILASYFVSVDFMLFSQYLYYSLSSSKPDSLLGPSSYHYDSHGRQISETSYHYRAFSSASTISGSGQEVRSRSNTLSPVRPIHHRSSTSITHSEEIEAEDEVDEGALAALTESFHSELGRKRVSWSQERFGHRGSTSRTRTFPEFTSLVPIHTSQTLAGPCNEGIQTPNIGDRGRRREKLVTDSPLDIIDLENEQNSSQRACSLSLARGRRNSRASQHSLGLVFLGVWALFSFGKFSGYSYMNSDPTGIVLAATTSEATYSAIIPTYVNSDDFFEGKNDVDAVLTPSLVAAPPPESTEQTESDSSIKTNTWSERVVGRIFAWMCTALYLTSRLPQIWKNYQRKSVEGLSMYLFVFAFLGNTFYVLSILTSPMMAQSRPAATAFLVESIPYLLGSGGTLLFDVTIVTQSYIYRSHLNSSNTSNTLRSHTRTNSKASDLDNEQQDENHWSNNGTSSTPVARSKYVGVARASDEEQTLLGSSSPRLGSRMGAVDADLEHGHEYGYGHRRDPRGTGVSASQGAGSRRRKDTYSSDASLLEESAVH